MIEITGVISLAKPGRRSGSRVRTRVGTPQVGAPQRCANCARGSSEYCRETDLIFIDEQIAVPDDDPA